MKWGWLILFTAAAGFSDEARISATSHSIFSNTQDIEDTSSPRNTEFMHEAQVRADWRRYSFGIEFANTIVTDQSPIISQPMVLEKGFAIADWDDFKITLGDSYQEFGKGIALSLNRNSVFGTDNTLQGGSFEYRPKSFGVSLFGGRVSAVKAPVSLYPTPTSLIRNELLLAGAQVYVKPVSDTKISGHTFTAINRPLNSTRFDKGWNTVGASLSRDGLFDAVDLYAESNVLMPFTMHGPDGERGYGHYASISWVPLDWRLQVEGKDYRQETFEFRRPPTLEEDIVENPNITNVSAGRASAEYKIDPARAWSVFSSYLYGDDRDVHSPVHHVVVGTKFLGPAMSRIELKTGYRTFPGRDNLGHASIKGKIPTFTGQTAEVGFRKYSAMTNLHFAPAKEDRNNVDVSYVFGEAFSLGLNYEFVPTNQEASGRHFINATTQVRVADLSTKIMAGKTSGGTMCSAGVCQRVPPFSGVMLETTYRF